MTSRHRVLVAAPIAAAALLLTAACGSGDSAAGPAPLSTAPTTIAPTTTPASPPPSETAQTNALSRFESDPAVKALRKFAAAVGTSINGDDASLKAAWPVMTAHGRTVFQQVAASDVKLFYPGPLPITPTRVQHAGATARISSCVWLAGWGQDPKTKLPADGRKVGPIAWVLHREAGAWKVDDQVYVNIDCSKVSVKGVAW